MGRCSVNRVYLIGRPKMCVIRVGLRILVYAIGRTDPIGNGGDMMKIGYIRISTAEQNIARQEVMMAELGVDEVFIDRMSGKNTNRPELQRLLEYVRQGDVVIYVDDFRCGGRIGKRIYFATTA